MPKTFNRSYPASSNTPHWDRTADYDSGAIPTEHGYVLVESAGDKGPHAFAALRFIYGGRAYFRGWEARYGRRHLTTLAKRFAREIATAGDGR